MSHTGNVTATIADTQTDAHILCVGEALIDIVQHHASTHTREIPGGSPANVAMTIGRLGRPVRLSTWLGNDARGQVIAEHMRASHVQITPESFGASRTSTAQALVDEHGSATYQFDVEWAPSLPLRMSPDAVIVHTGSIASVLEPGATTVFETLKAAHTHALITYDPNIRPSLMGTPWQALPYVDRLVSLADVVKVSDEDVDWLTDHAEMERIVDRWLSVGPSLVVVTRGPHGALVKTRSGVRIQVPAADVPVVDTMGAGDSFMGGIIDALWRLGLTGAAARPRLDAINEAETRWIAEHSSAISGITIARTGANPPWAEELAAVEHNSPTSSIV